MNRTVLLVVGCMLALAPLVADATPLVVGAEHSLDVDVVMTGALDAPMLSHSFDVIRVTSMDALSAADDSFRPMTIPDHSIARTAFVPGIDAGNVGTLALRAAEVGGWPC